MLKVGVIGCGHRGPNLTRNFSACPSTSPRMICDLDPRRLERVAALHPSAETATDPEVTAFEEEFAAEVGARHACAVSSCTTALHLALAACGVRPGDEVITVSHTFIATVNAIRYCGATPILVDIDPLTYNIDPTLIAPAITPRTKVIMPVHQMGMPADIDAVRAIARDHGLAVIEDAACAIGSSYRDRTIGGDAALACFSFHSRKVVATGDVGMIVTNEGGFDQEFRLLRQHGMSVPDRVRHESSKVVFEEYVGLGYNYRMTDIQAAVGRVQLRRLPEMLLRRRALAAEYDAALKEHPHLRPPFVPDYAHPNYQSYPVRVAPSSPIARNDLMQALLDRGIATRRGVMNVHREPAYTGVYPSLSLPESEAAADEAIMLPLFSEMTRGELGYVVENLLSLCPPR